MSAPGRTLVLVPTEIERRHLARQPRFGVDAPCELCGFGPVAAAARAAALIDRHRPDRLLLVGIAGTFDPATLPVGTAAAFGRAVLDGVGVGSGAAFVPAGTMGFAHWTDEAGGWSVGDELELATPVPPAPGPLLTCCAAAGSAEEARWRRARVPGATAEDMEGFGVALAGRLAAVPVAVVRGISNEVGDRRVDRWRVPEALEAAWAAAAPLLDRPDWTR